MAVRRGKAPAAAKPPQNVSSRVRLARRPKVFEPADWYSSEEAKRRLSPLCVAVNKGGLEIGIMGTSEKPLMLLQDADGIEEVPGEIELSIEEIKADWSAVTAAVCLYGTTFRIVGKKVPRAVLRRHPVNRHSALKYRRSASSDLSGIAKQLEKLLDDLRSLSERLDMSGQLIDRRFKDIWRASQGLEIRALHS